MRTHLQVLDAQKLPNNTAIAKFSMVVVQNLCNRTGMLHGGAMSMIVDMATTLAQAPLATAGYWEFGGVSRTLNVTYLRPIPKDTEILIVCEVMQVGKALGMSWISVEW
jgi:acyl-coenzyme A thioesterase 13